VRVGCGGGGEVLCAEDRRNTRVIASVFAGIGVICVWLSVCTGFLVS
jgi:hypothetical protein